MVNNWDTEEYSFRNCWTGTSHSYEYRAITRLGYMWEIYFPRHDDNDWGILRWRQKPVWIKGLFLFLSHSGNFIVWLGPFRDRLGLLLRWRRSCCWYYCGGPNTEPEVSVYFKVGRPLEGCLWSSSSDRWMDKNYSQTALSSSFVSCLTPGWLLGNSCPFTSLLVSSALSVSTSTIIISVDFYGAINM